MRFVFILTLAGSPSQVRNLLARRGCRVAIAVVKDGKSCRPVSVPQLRRGASDVSAAVIQIL